MPGYKRKNSNVGKGGYKRRKSFARPKRRLISRLTNRVANTRIRRVVQAMSETKSLYINYKNNFGVQHNTILPITTNMLPVTNGMSTEEGNNNPIGIRIGNKLFCKGIHLKFMFENDQAYPLVTFRYWVVRPKIASTSTITDATFFEGCASNKFMDYVNKTPYEIMATGTVKVGNGPSTGSGGSSLGPPGSGNQLSLAHRFAPLFCVYGGWGGGVLSPL